MWKRRPDPIPGTNVELGFLGTVIHVEMPEAIETQQSMSAVSPARLNETDIQVESQLTSPLRFLTRVLDLGFHMPIRPPNIGAF